MIIRLHNLSSRPPTLADVKAVTELIRASDVAASGMTGVTEEQIRSLWQETYFDLKRDAWVIVTKSREIVGYAAVQQSENGQFQAVLYVHPSYRGRGIGTLLLWLGEERARQLMSCIDSTLRVSLSIHASRLHKEASHLLERENYAWVRGYWRVMIDINNCAASSGGISQGRKLNVDLIVDAHDIASIMQLQQRTEVYAMQQYDVYEKELRAGVVQQKEELCYSQL